MYRKTLAAAPRVPLLQLAPLIATMACACSSQKPEPSPSLVIAGDPRSSYRSLSGFYGAEQNRWRWTGRTFAVVLSASDDRMEESRRLVLRFVIPHEVARQLLPLEISATIAGVDLRPEVFRADGRQTYMRVIPNNLLVEKEIQVAFSLSRSIPPSPSDLRELGIIVESVGFE